MVIAATMAVCWWRLAPRTRPQRAPLTRPRRQPRTRPAQARARRLKRTATARRRQLPTPSRCQLHRPRFPRHLILCLQETLRYRAQLAVLARLSHPLRLEVPAEWWQTSWVVFSEQLVSL